MLLKWDKKIIGKVTDEGQDFPIISLEYIRDPALPFVLIAAGMHGNEPASVRALEEFLEEGINEYAAKYNFVIFPRINPVGCARGTRENGNGVDLNRNFLSEKPEEEVRAIQKYLAALNKKFLVAIDMHEDATDAIVPGYDSKDNPRGMYLYEVSSSDQRIGEQVLFHLRDDGIAIADNRIIYGENAEEGLIWTPPSYDPLRAGSFTDKYLLEYTDHTFVIETPTCWSFPERVAAHKKALSFILDAQEGVASRDKARYK
ncbi:MAG: M14 family metallocarboxypeptidase [Parcubacteria group bacterium]|nr:M14 family metallocarboxypeptidase [Parcubacteria group bacterium]